MLEQGVGLQYAQFIVSLLFGGGLVFGLGRIAERITNLSKSHVEHEQRVKGSLDEIKDALFGADGGDGAFARRTEVAMMVEKTGQEHAAFDRRLEDQAKDIGGLQVKIASLEATRRKGAGEELVEADVRLAFQKINSKLDFLIRAALIQQLQEVAVSQELDDLKAEVAAVTTVEQSAIALISGISARIQAAIDAGGSAADFVKMKSDLDASSQALAAAVSANTPAA